MAHENLAAATALHQFVVDHGVNNCLEGSRLSLFYEQFPQFTKFIKQCGTAAFCDSNKKLLAFQKVNGKNCIVAIGNMSGLPKMKPVDHEEVANGAIALSCFINDNGGQIKVDKLGEFYDQAPSIKKLILKKGFANFFASDACKLYVQQEVDASGKKIYVSKIAEDAPTSSSRSSIAAPTCSFGPILTSCSSDAMALLRHMFNDDSLKCPITLEMMRDPVITKYGNSFERSSMDDWMKGGTRMDPINSMELHPHEVFDNRALKHLIDRYVELVGTSINDPVEVMTSATSVAANSSSSSSVGTTDVTAEVSNVSLDAPAPPTQSSTSVSTNSHTTSSSSVIPVEDMNVAAAAPAQKKLTKKEREKAKNVEKAAAKKAAAALAAAASSSLSSSTAPAVVPKSTPTIAPPRMTEDDEDDEFDDLPPLLQCDSSSDDDY